MSNKALTLADILDRLDTQITVQHCRVGLMQRLLDEQGSRLEALSARADRTSARLDALLATSHRRRR